MHGEFTDEDTQPGYPLLPMATHKNWELYDITLKGPEMTSLVSFPRDVNNYPIAVIYDGDCLGIQLHIRFGPWVAARAGDKVGWLKTSDISLAEAEDLPSITAPAPASDDDADSDTREVQVSMEVLARMRAMASKDPEAQVTLSHLEVSRIMIHLRGITNTLRQARNRARNWGPNTSD